jgi:hypothetical protein
VPLDTGTSGSAVGHRQSGTNFSEETSQQIIDTFDDCGFSDVDRFGNNRPSGVVTDL